MALPMPRPFEHKNGTFYLNVRMPADLPSSAKGKSIALSIGGTTVQAAVTDKIFCSLRTKDPALAKERFTLAYGALAKQLDALRSGPKSLTHKEIVALAGLVYRDRADRFDADQHFVPDGMNAAEQEFQQAVQAFLGMATEPADSEQALGEAIYRATAAMPKGPQVLAWHLGEDIDYLGVAMTLDQALEDLFGRRADRLCAENGLRIDVATRRKLLQQIGEVYSLIIGKLKRNRTGDYSPDPNLNRFPTFLPP